MLFLIALACTSPPPADEYDVPDVVEPDIVEPDITVVLEMEGMSLGEMQGGFGIVESWSATDDTEARQQLRVVLGTWPDPCGSLTGFYEDHDPGHPLARFLRAFIATRAIKP